MYFDARREKLARKRKHYTKLEDGTVSGEERMEVLRENIQRSWSRTEVRKNAHRSSNIRIILLIALIVGLGYFIFNGIDEVDTIVNKLW